MFEGILSDLLVSFLGDIVAISREQVKVSLFSAASGVVLHDLRLRAGLADRLDLPVKIVDGRVGALVVRIPWTELRTAAIRIEVRDVEIVASPRDEREWDEGPWAERSRQAKAAALAARSRVEDAAVRAVLEQALGADPGPATPGSASAVGRAPAESSHGAGSAAGRSAGPASTAGASAQAPRRSLPARALGRVGQAAVSSLTFLVSVLAQRVQVVVSNVTLRFVSRDAATGCDTEVVLRLAELTTEGAGDRAQRNAEALLRRSLHLRGLSVACGTASTPPPAPLLAPLSARVDVAVSASRDLSDLHVDVDVAVPTVRANIDSMQVVELSRIAGEAEIWAKRQRYGRFRPADWRPLGPGGSWRKAWCYAVQCALHDVREARGWWSAADMRAKSRLRTEYLELYQAKLERQERGAAEELTSHASVSLARIEDELPLDTIVVLRAIARRRVRKDKRSADGAGVVGVASRWVPGMSTLLAGARRLGSYLPSAAGWGGAAHGASGQPGDGALDVDALQTALQAAVASRAVRVALGAPPGAAAAPLAVRASVRASVSRVGVDLAAVTELSLRNDCDGSGEAWSGAGIAPGTPHVTAPLWRGPPPSPGPRVIAAVSDRAAVAGFESPQSSRSSEAEAPLSSAAVARNSDDDHGRRPALQWLPVVSLSLVGIGVAVAADSADNVEVGAWVETVAVRTAPDAWAAIDAAADGLPSPVKFGDGSASNAPLRTLLATKDALPGAPTRVAELLSTFRAAHDTLASRSRSVALPALPPAVAVRVSLRPGAVDAVVGEVYRSASGNEVGLGKRTPGALSGGLATPARVQSAAEGLPPAAAHAAAAFTPPWRAQSGGMGSGRGVAKQPSVGNSGVFETDTFSEMGLTAADTLAAGWDPLSGLTQGAIAPPDVSVRVAVAPIVLAPDVDSLATLVQLGDLCAPLEPSIGAQARVWLNAIPSSTGHLARQARRALSSIGAPVPDVRVCLEGLEVRVRAGPNAGTGAQPSLPSPSRAAPTPRMTGAGDWGGPSIDDPTPRLPRSMERRPPELTVAVGEVTVQIPAPDDAPGEESALCRSGLADSGVMGEEQGRGRAESGAALRAHARALVELLESSPEDPRLNAAVRERVVWAAPATAVSVASVAVLASCEGVSPARVLDADGLSLRARSPLIGADPYFPAQTDLRVRPVRISASVDAVCALVELTEALLGPADAWTVTRAGAAERSATCVSPIWESPSTSPSHAAGAVRGARAASCSPWQALLRGESLVTEPAQLRRARAARAVTCAALRAAQRGAASALRLDAESLAVVGSCAEAVGVRQAAVLDQRPQDVLWQLAVTGVQLQSVSDAMGASLDLTVEGVELRDLWRDWPGPGPEPGQQWTPLLRLPPVLSSAAISDIRLALCTVSDVATAMRERGLTPDIGREVPRQSSVAVSVAHVALLGPGATPDCHVVLGSEEGSDGDSRAWAHAASSLGLDAVWGAQGAARRERRPFLSLGANEERASVSVHGVQVGTGWVRLAPGLVSHLASAMRQAAKELPLDRVGRIVSVVGELQRAQAGHGGGVNGGMGEGRDEMGPTRVAGAGRSDGVEGKGATTPVVVPDVEVSVSDICVRHLTQVGVSGADRGASQPSSAAVAPSSVQQSPAAVEASVGKLDFALPASLVRSALATVDAVRGAPSNGQPGAQSKAGVDTETAGASNEGKIALVALLDSAVPGTGLDLGRDGQPGALVVIAGVKVAVKSIDNYHAESGLPTPRTHSAAWVGLPRMAVTGRWECRDGHANAPTPATTSPGPLESVLLHVSLGDVAVSAVADELAGWLPALVADSAQLMREAERVGCVVNKQVEPAIADLVAAVGLPERAADGADGEARGAGEGEGSQGSQQQSPLSQVSETLRAVQAALPGAAAAMGVSLGSLTVAVTHLGQAGGSGKGGALHDSPAAVCLALTGVGAGVAVDTRARVMARATLGGIRAGCGPLGFDGRGRRGGDAVSAFPPAFAIRGVRMSPHCLDEGSAKQASSVEVREASVERATGWPVAVLDDRLDHGSSGGQLPDSPHGDGSAVGQGMPPCLSLGSLVELRVAQAHCGTSKSASSEQRSHGAAESAPDAVRVSANLAAGVAALAREARADGERRRCSNGAESLGRESVVAVDVSPLSLAVDAGAVTGAAHAAARIVGAVLAAAAEAAAAGASGGPGEGLADGGTGVARSEVAATQPVSRAVNGSGLKAPTLDASGGTASVSASTSLAPNAELDTRLGVSGPGVGIQWLSRVPVRVEMAVPRLSLCLVRAMGRERPLIIAATDGSCRDGLCAAWAGAVIGSVGFRGVATLGAAAAHDQGADMGAEQGVGRAHIWLSLQGACSSLHVLATVTGGAFSEASTQGGAAQEGWVQARGGGEKQAGREGEMASDGNAGIDPADAEAALGPFLADGVWLLGARQAVVFADGSGADVAAVLSAGAEGVSRCDVRMSARVPDVHASLRLSTATALASMAGAVSQDASSAAAALAPVLGLLGGRAAGEGQSDGCEGGASTQPLGASTTAHVLDQSMPARTLWVVDCQTDVHPASLHVTLVSDAGPVDVPVLRARIDLAGASAQCQGALSDHDSRGIDVSGRAEAGASLRIDRFVSESACWHQVAVVGHTRASIALSPDHPSASRNLSVDMRVSEALRLSACPGLGHTARAATIATTVVSGAFLGRAAAFWAPGRSAIGRVCHPALQSMPGRQPGSHKSPGSACHTTIAVVNATGVPLRVKPRSCHRTWGRLDGPEAALPGVGCVSAAFPSPWIEKGAREAVTVRLDPVDRQEGRVRATVQVASNAADLEVELCVADGPAGAVGLSQGRAAGAAGIGSGGSGRRVCVVPLVPGSRGEAEVATGEGRRVVVWEVVRGAVGGVEVRLSGGPSVVNNTCHRLAIVISGTSDNTESRGSAALLHGASARVNKAIPWMHSDVVIVPPRASRALPLRASSDLSRAAACLLPCPWPADGATPMFAPLWATDGAATVRLPVPQACGEEWLDVDLAIGGVGQGGESCGVAEEEYAALCTSWQAWRNPRGAPAAGDDRASSAGNKDALYALLTARKDPSGRVRVEAAAPAVLHSHSAQSLAVHLGRRCVTLPPGASCGIYENPTRGIKVAVPAPGGPSQLGPGHCVGWVHLSSSGCVAWPEGWAAAPVSFAPPEGLSAAAPAPMVAAWRGVWGAPGTANLGSVRAEERPVEVRILAEISAVSWLPVPLMLSLRRGDPATASAAAGAPLSATVTNLPAAPSSLDGAPSPPGASSSDRAVQGAGAGALDMAEDACVGRSKSRQEPSASFARLAVPWSPADALGINAVLVSLHCAHLALGGPGSHHGAPVTVRVPTKPRSGVSYHRVPVPVPGGVFMPVVLEQHRLDHPAPVSAGVWVLRPLAHVVNSSGATLSISAHGGPRNEVPDGHTGATRAAVAHGSRWTAVVGGGDARAPLVDSLTVCVHHPSGLCPPSRIPLNGPGTYRFMLRGDGSGLPLEARVHVGHSGEATCVISRAVFVPACVLNHTGRAVSVSQMGRTGVDVALLGPGQLASLCQTSQLQISTAGGRSLGTLPWPRGEKPRTFVLTALGGDVFAQVGHAGPYVVIRLASRPRMSISAKTLRDFTGHAGEMGRWAAARGPQHRHAGTHAGAVGLGSNPHRDASDGGSLRVDVSVHVQDVVLSIEGTAGPVAQVRVTGMHAGLETLIRGAQEGPRPSPGIAATVQHDARQTSAPLNLDGAWDGAWGGSQTGHTGSPSDDAQPSSGPSSGPRSLAVSLRVEDIEVVNSLRGAAFPLVLCRLGRVSSRGVMWGMGLVQTGAEGESPQGALELEAEVSEGPAPGVVVVDRVSVGVRPLSLTVQARLVIELVAAATEIAQAAGLGTAAGSRLAEGPPSGLQAEPELRMEHWEGRAGHALAEAGGRGAVRWVWVRHAAVGEVDVVANALMSWGHAVASSAAAHRGRVPRWLLDAVASAVDVRDAWIGLPPLRVSGVTWALEDVPLRILELPGVHAAVAGNVLRALSALGWGQALGNPALAFSLLASRVKLLVMSLAAAATPLPARGPRLPWDPLTHAVGIVSGAGAAASLMASRSLEYGGRVLAAAVPPAEEGTGEAPDDTWEAYLKAGDSTLAGAARRAICGLVSEPARALRDGGWSAVPFGVLQGLAGAVVHPGVFAARYSSNVMLAVASALSGGAVEAPGEGAV